MEKSNIPKFMLIAVLSLALAALALAATQNPINFDTFPDCVGGGAIDGTADGGNGTEMTTQYDCQGISTLTSNSGGPRARQAALAVSGLNVLNSFGPGDGPDGIEGTADDLTAACCEGFIRVDFSVSMTTVEFTARDIGGDGLRLEAFDALDNLLGFCEVNSAVANGFGNTHLMNVCTASANACDVEDDSGCGPDIAYVTIDQITDDLTVSDGYAIDDLSSPDFVPVELQSFAIE